MELFGYDNAGPLYKFVTDTTVKFLLDGSLKFTLIHELNDPTELVASVNAGAVAESRERLRKEGYSDEDLVNLKRQGALLKRLAPAHQAIPVPSTAALATNQIRASFYDDTAVLQHLLTQTADLIASKVGVLCLTARMDSLPMWAHYAANARGVVVEFTDLATTFSGDDTGILKTPKPVQYASERLGVTFDPQSHEDLFFAKFEDWRYEREIRVVLPLDECRLVDAYGSKIHIFEVPKTHIARLILGWHVSETKEKTIIREVRKRNPSVVVVRADIQGGQVKISDQMYP